MMKRLIIILAVLLWSPVMAADTVLVGLDDHQFMGYMINSSTTTLPTFFYWNGQPVVEVSGTGVVLRYKKNGVWVTVQ